MSTPFSYKRPTTTMADEPVTAQNRSTRIIQHAKSLIRRWRRTRPIGPDQDRVARYLAVGGMRGHRG